MRRTLLAAALELISESGINGFTLREVARRAGVSHAAPHHHFADKAALVEAVVIESFETLAATMRTSLNPAAGTALDNLRGLGLAYVQFALANPAAFRMMFRADLRHSATPEANPVVQASNQAFQVLVAGIADCQAAELIQAGSPELYAFSAWSTVHGLAELLLEGYPNLTEAASPPEEIAQWVIQSLLQGLAKE